MELCRAWNRHDPGPLREEPCERDLCRRRVLALGEAFQPLDEGEVRLPVLLGEPWHAVAEISRLECGLVIDRAGQKTLTERTERYEPNSEFLECGQHLALGLAEPQG